jgi:DNA polymerase-1
LRKVFCAKDENHILIDADYSQIELRVLADISGDESLIKSFQNNEDIHRSTAAEVFGVPLEMVTNKMRSRAKAVNSELFTA